MESVDGDVAHVNMSLIFVHGLARCGPDYGDFPGRVVGGGWVSVNSSRISAFERLTVTRSVDVRGSEVAGGAVEYDGRYYLGATSISEAAYSEGSVLLYASVKNVDLFYLLPYPVVKLFGIIIASTPYSTVTLKLSDTNMPLT